MTEHQLRDKLISVAPSAVYANESEIRAIVDLAKTYADAKVADEIKVLDETVTLLHQTIANRNVEIAELKAESKYWKDRWEAQNKANDAEFSSIIAQNAENKRLNAEVERLRDALMWLKVNRTPDRAMIEVFIDKAISPAPVTEGPKKTFSLQMYECNRCEWYGQVGESIETESYDVCPKCLSEDLTLLDSPKNEDQE